MQKKNLGRGQIPFTELKITKKTKTKRQTNNLHRLPFSLPCSFTFTLLSEKHSSGTTVHIPIFNGTG